MLSKEAVSLLIRKYKEHENLYDVSHPLYLDRVKRSISLYAICKDLKRLVPDITVDDIKRKVHSLRSQYARELRDLANFKENALNDDDEYEPKLWCFSQLEYLKPFCTKKKMEGFMPAPSKDTPSIPYPKKQKVSEEDDMADVVIDAFEESGNDLSVLAQGWSTQYAELSRQQKVFARKIISDVLFHGCLDNLTQSTVKQIQSIFESNADKGCDSLHNEE